MSFVGDLEHLPIVDVIQLLHATRKSGTLCLKSARGESQLGFSDGCIVSANHSNNSVRIGQILVQKGKISQEDLEATLGEQTRSGSARTPLIALLIESGRLNKEDAFKGLETLIELTIVEVLTWTEGTFELDVESTIISDEYRYIPENLKLDLNLNTQNVLMDALRIYDEKKRDGTLESESFMAMEQSFAPSPTEETMQNSQVISIDDLGLDVLDDLEKVIPGFFTPVKVHDPTMIHRERAGSSLDEIAPQEQEQLFAYLSRLEAENSAGQQHAATHALVLFSSSEFLRHIVMTACRHSGFFTFSTDDVDNLEMIFNQSFAKNLIPVLLIDYPPGKGDERLNMITSDVLKSHPDLAVFHLKAEPTFGNILTSLESGARALLPKPDPVLHKGSFVENSIRFLDSIRKCLKVTPRFQAVQVAHKLPENFTRCMEQIWSRKELHEITAVIDSYIASITVRSVTFTIRRSDLVCDSLNVSSAVSPLSITFSAEGDSPLHATIKNGILHNGAVSHPLLNEKLYGSIGAPAVDSGLVVPFKCLGRVLAVTYGDFGKKTPTEVDQELISILVRAGGIVYENSLYRKKFEKMLHSQQ